MDIIQLKCLVEVCRSGNFTSAAEVLNMSQPNLSKKIASLEDEIGMKLLERNKREVRPTGAGISFSADAEKILASLDEALKHAKAIDNGTEGYLRVGISDELDFNGLLPSFLHDFRAAHPSIWLDISIRKIPELPDLLETDELDIIFLPYIGRRCFRCQVESLPINRNHPHLYFSIDNKKAKRPNLSIEDFLNESLILIQSTEDRSAQILSNHGYVFKSTIYAESMQALKIYLEANLGVAVLGVSQSFLNTSKVAKINLPMDTRLIGTDSVFKKNPSNSSVMIFVDELRKYLKISS